MTSRPYKESYHVLRNDKTIKHGEYEKGYGDRLIKGKFDNNKRVGIWDYLDQNGEPELRIDFYAEKVLLSKPFVFIDKFMIADRDSLEEVKPEEEPIFLGVRSNSVMDFIMNEDYGLATLNRKRALVHDLTIRFVAGMGTFPVYKFPDESLISELVLKYEQGRYKVWEIKYKCEN